jgi:hypothetical protein
MPLECQDLKAISLMGGRHSSMIPSDEASVWIVSYWDYDDVRIYGVFTDQDKAQKYMDALTKPDSRYAELDEFFLDPPPREKGKKKITS